MEINKVPNILFLRGIFLEESTFDLDESSEELDLSKIREIDAAEELKGLNDIDNVSIDILDDDDMIKALEKKLLVDLDDVEEQTAIETTDMPNLFASNDHYNIIKYDNIPKYFVNKEQWIKNTNLLCWSCSTKFSGVPLFIPLGWRKLLIPISNDESNSISERSDILENLTELSDAALLLSNYKFKEVKAIETHGNFCSPLCAVRRIRGVRDPKITNTWESYKLLKLVCKGLYDVEILEIPEAEDPCRMIQYCGPKGITVQEFRNKNNTKFKNFNYAVKQNGINNDIII